MTDTTDQLPSQYGFYPLTCLIGQNDPMVSIHRTDDMIKVSQMLLNYDVYQPGFSYAVNFDSDLKKLNLAFSCIYNQLFNIFGCEGLSDAVSVILVDNNLEKYLITPGLVNFAQNYQFRVCTQISQLDFCSHGVCVVTLDEVPALVQKLTDLNNERETHLLDLQAFISQRINQNQGRDKPIENLPAKDIQTLEQLLDRAGISLNPPAPVISLYSVNEQVETVLSYIQDPDRCDYLTKHFTVTSEEAEEVVDVDTSECDEVKKLATKLATQAIAAGTNPEQVVPQVLASPKFIDDQTISDCAKRAITNSGGSTGSEETVQPIREYSYRSVPIGTLFVYSGYIYNNPEYYELRKYLLDFIKALVPSMFIWAEYKGQENYIPLEEYTRFPIRKVIYAENVLESTTYFFKRVPGHNFERFNLQPLNEYQDFKCFAMSNGFSINKTNQIRINPGKLFVKLRDVSAQLALALALAQLNRSVLLVVNDRVATVATINEILNQNKAFKGFIKSLNIVQADQLLHFSYTCNVAVIETDVSLTQDLLAHLSNIIVADSKLAHDAEASAMIIYSGNDTDIIAKKKSKTKKSDVELEAEGELFDTTVLQHQAVVDFLRNRRITARVPYEINEVDYLPGITDNCLQALEYFTHQEKRNWNSQLSGDKFLTVRCNNREISYYPNLSNNSFVLMGFNNHFLDNPLTATVDRGHFDIQDMLIDSNHFNLNLNSGDLITNISVAIHRIINYFTNRTQRVSSDQHINVIWMVNPDQAALLPLYEKLFSNIFNKEDVDVKIQYLDKFFQSLPLKDNGQYDLGELEVKASSKVNYDKFLTFMRKFIPFYLTFAPDVIASADLVKFDTKDSINQTIAKINQIFTSDTHAAFEELLIESPQLAKQYYYFKQDKPATKVQGQSNIFLCTTDEYIQYYAERLKPDLLVFENMYDLYRSNTAPHLANILYTAHDIRQTPRSIILVSSPEADVEHLLARCEMLTGTVGAIDRPNNINLALNQSSAERHAYVVDFAKEVFADPSYWELQASSYDVSTIAKHFSSQQANNVINASVQGFHLPLAAYVLPTTENPDYSIVVQQQLASDKVHGYVPALGESSVEIGLHYYSFTASKLLNAVLAVMTAPKNSKSRGLVVVNRPEVKALLEEFGKQFNFVVHDFNSLSLERAVFSHSVIIADPSDYVEQAIIQHTTLLTRGFKTTGSIFFFCHAPYQQELFALLASNNQAIRQSRMLELEPSTLPTKAQKTNFISSDQISPHFYYKVPRKEGTDPFFPNELPGVKAKRARVDQIIDPEHFGELDPDYIHNRFKTSNYQDLELEIANSNPSFNKNTKRRGLKRRK